MRSKKREIVAFEATAPNTPAQEHRTSRSLTCSTSPPTSPKPSLAEASPRSGRNQPNGPHTTRKPKASTKDVTTFNPECEISDWPVAATRIDRKALVFLDIRKVLLSAGNKVRQHHIFPAQKYFSSHKHTPGHPHS